MKVVVNKQCIGCGTCAALAPNSFKINEEDRAEFIEGSTDDAETINMAASSCPVQAIEVEE